MYKVYNNQEEFATNITDFLLKCIPDIRKTQLKIIPYILLGLILAESIVASDIAKKLKGDFTLVQHDSVVKRLRRFFANKLFKPYVFYDAIIKYIIKKFKSSHPDKIVQVVFDHMFSHDNYTVFMITMRIGKQGIPLWFRCFKGKSDESAFQEDLLKQGIKYVSDLFGNDFNLVFLADRWFNSTSLLEYIANLGHTFCVRAKKNIKIKLFDKKENKYVWKTLGDLPSYKNRAVYYKDAIITDKEFKVNIAISMNKGVAEPWIILTNGEANRAIRNYSYRFGAIECVFKSQKSNGFYLESCNNASLEVFTSMYAIACFGILFLTIQGIEYSKNNSCYKNVTIKTHTKRNGIKLKKTQKEGVEFLLKNKKCIL